VCLEGEEPDDKRRAIKGKILQVGRMSRVFGLLREEAESGSELKGVEGVPHPGETLIDGAEEVKSVIKGFGQACVLLSPAFPCRGSSPLARFSS
jgi:serine/threonine-protein phosphatase 2B catalytic subunit